MSVPSFSLLPDEITLNYLARIPRSYYSTLSIVSKSFYSLLSSTDLYVERSLLGNTEQCLYVCLRDLNTQSTQWFALYINPNPTLINSSMMKNNKKAIRQLFLPIPPSNFPLISKSTVAVVGSKIYVIGGLVNGALTSTVGILDCRSHTWSDAPSMNAAREDAASCVYDGKIYVIGGFRGSKNDESWAEVFDTKTQTWERLPCPDNEICTYFLFRIAEIEGKIYVRNYSNKEYAYDTKQGKWECCNDMILTDPRRPMCVIENVIYSCDYDPIDGYLMCFWYDTNAQIWREVQGLKSLRDKQIVWEAYTKNRMRKLISCDGKLLIMWEAYTKNYKRNIWCTEIVVEKRDGDEVWGNVEWVDIMHTIPWSYELLHLLAVSV